MLSPSCAPLPLPYATASLTSLTSRDRPFEGCVVAPDEHGRCRMWITGLCAISAWPIPPLASTRDSCVAGGGVHDAPPWLVLPERQAPVSPLAALAMASPALWPRPALNIAPPLHVQVWLCAQAMLSAWAGAACLCPWAPASICPEPLPLALYPWP